MILIPCFTWMCRLLYRNDTISTASADFYKFLFQSYPKIVNLHPALQH